jgi:hypothetical protein
MNTLKQKQRILLNKIIEFYIEKESKTDFTEKFFVYRKDGDTFDSILNGVDLFAKLSDNNQIGIKCKLNNDDARLILNILYHIILWKDEEPDYLSEEDFEDKEKAKNLFVKLEKDEYQIQDWIDLLSNFEKVDIEDFNDEENYTIFLNDRGNEYKNMQVYKTFPPFEKYYKGLGKKQTFYTLNDLLEL